MFRIVSSLLAKRPKVCRCGQPWEAHQHLRAGTDCGDCPRFRRRWRT